jgi:hypothetical protein
VSNVMRPHPMRTGCGVSVAKIGRVTPKTRANATAVERFFTIATPDCVDIVNRAHEIDGGLPA